jgi:polyferredoxin
VTVDLLRTPFLGTFLRWRHARTALQIGMLAVAIAVIFDGLFGPQLGPRNLAGVLPWLHWRGMVVLAILLFGNFFCMACPFMLTRRAGKTLLPGDRNWPTALKSKWLAAALLILFFWAYEAFDIWTSPWWSAWVALAYFVGAFVIDGLFKGAAFCKYICPIGHFHFINATLSPFEVAVRQPDICSGCRTKDCISGRRDRGIPLPVLAREEPALVPLPAQPPGAKIQNGCELWLFQQKKVGNVDCTFCMECIQACPHGNVGILSRQPASELWKDPLRSGIGRFSQRPDLAFLALIMVSTAFLNAFGMVAPVYATLDWITSTLGIANEVARVGVLMITGTVILPVLLAGAAAWISRTASGSGRSVVAEATRFVYGLIPLGFGMWLAHHLFHFLLGALTIVPLGKSYLRDLGLGPAKGTAGVDPVNWAVPPLIPEAWLAPLELFFIELGLLVSLVVLWRIARRDNSDRRAARLAFAPWGGLAVALSLIGIWLLLQPMEMRGTMMGG